MVTSDHRPHKKIFGDKPLDEFTSERLFNLRRRTSKWRYKVVHVPGKSIPASDAASRYPSDDGHGPPENLDSDPDLDFLAALRIESDDEDFEYTVVASARSAMDRVKAVTWERVKQETQADTHLVQLINYVVNGFPSKPADLPLPLQPYWSHREKLSVVDNVLMCEHRVLIPPTLRNEVSNSLHSAHQGVTGMGNRARASVFWPGISTSIEDTRNSCSPCDRMAPSQPFQAPIPPITPTLPFEAIAADYFALGGHYYLVSVDRFSNWPEVKQIKRSENNVGSSGLIKALKHLFAGFGVPTELSSDGGPEFKSADLDDFLHRWGVTHRMSSAYHPRSNGRAEVTVKAMKRLLQNNIGPQGEIDTDRYVQAILQFRNTPDSDSGLSPSEVLFGRPLRDVLPFPPRSQVYDNPSIRPLWKDIWSQKEHSLRIRFGKQVDSLTPRTRNLPPLNVGDVCRVQNQAGASPTKWDRTGVVVQVNENDQYHVKMHGSGRLTLRNRKFLRKIHSYTAVGTPSYYAPVPTSTPSSTPHVATDQANPSNNPQSSADAPSTQQHSSDTTTSAPTVQPVSAPESCPNTTAASTPPSQSLPEHNILCPPPASQAESATPPRPSRERRPPPWHNDYKMH